MKKTALLLLTALAALAWEDNDKAVVAWVRTNAIALRTREAGHGFEDMQPLPKIIGDARVVELGEAAHGTHLSLAVEIEPRKG
jgi:erythromycin esterase